MAPRRNALPAPGGLFESTGNRARQAAAGNPGVAGFNDRGASDFAAGLSALSGIVEGIQLQRDSVKGVGVETEATVQAQKDTAALNPLDKDYQEQVKAVWDNAKKRVMESGISSPAVLDDLAKRMDRHGAAMQIHAIGETKSAVNKQAIITYKDATDAISAKIRNDPANANLYMGEFQADAARLKVGMDPVAFEQVSRGAFDTFAKAQVYGYAEKGNFGAARNALKAQAEHLDINAATGMSRYIDGRESKARADGDRARTIMANDLAARMNDWAHGLGPPVPREEIDKLKGTANYGTMVGMFGAATEKLAGKSEREREKMIAQKATDISARISDAEAGKGPMPSREEIDALKQYRQYDELVKQHNHVEVKKRIERGKDEEAINASQNGTFKNQGQFDRYQRIVTGGLPIGALATRAPQEDWDKAVNFIRTQAAQHGYVSGETKAMLENADSVTDKSKAGFVGRVASLADDLEQNGQTPQGVTLRDTGTLAAVRAEAKLLMDTERLTKTEAFAKAAESVMTKGPVTIQQEKDRVFVAKTTLNSKEFDLPGKVKGVFASTGWFETNPAMGASLQATYRRLYEENAKRTDDPQQIEAMTKAAITRQYGPTAVGGVKEIVQYPVERELAKVTGAQFLTDDQKTAIVQREVLGILTERGLKPREAPDRPGQPPFKLVPSDRTVEDIRNGRPASGYQIMLQNGDTYYDTGLRYRVPNANELKTNDTYTIYESERTAKQLQDRQQYLDSDPKAREAIRNQKSRVPASTIDPGPQVEPKPPEPSGAELIRRNQRRGLPGGN